MSASIHFISEFSFSIGIASVSSFFSFATFLGFWAAREIHKAIELADFLWMSDSGTANQNTRMQTLVK